MFFFCHRAGCHRSSTFLHCSALSSKPLGPLELVPLLIPSTASTPPTFLQSTDLPSLLQDLSTRFTPSAANDFEAGLEEIIGPLVSHCSLLLVRNRTDVGGGGQGGPSWRDVVMAVQSLVEVKGVATMLPSCAGWDILAGLDVPQKMALAPSVEVRSLLGPLLRLSTFSDAFVSWPWPTSRTWTLVY